MSEKAITGAVTFSDGTVLPLSYAAHNGRTIESFEAGGKLYAPDELVETFELDEGHIVTLTVGGVKYAPARKITAEQVREAVLGNCESGIGYEADGKGAFPYSYSDYDWQAIADALNRMEATA